MTTEPVNERAVQNTARVINDLNPDILGVVEAENRIVLKEFTDAALRDGTQVRYPHVMLIDGNDDRGIDVAILTKQDWPLGMMRSHIDDTDVDGVIFSRDCPEFYFRTPGGHRLVVLVNHLKSKGYGSQADNDARRQRQAARVAQIYQGVVAEGYVYVAVLGDFNDTPDSPTLAPLLQASDLRDISTLPEFDDGGRPGTFGNCAKSQRIDYILLSPALFTKATGGAIFREGAWGGANGTMWPHYDTLTKATEAASDHCAIYADISLT